MIISNLRLRKFLSRRVLCCLSKSLVILYWSLLVLYLTLVSSMEHWLSFLNLLMLVLFKILINKRLNHAYIILISLYILLQLLKTSSPHCWFWDICCLLFSITYWLDLVLLLNSLSSSINYFPNLSLMLTYCQNWRNSFLHFCRG